VFRLAQFDILPALDQADPCFIEDETARFPGLHSTKVYAKTLEAAMADGMVTDQEAGEIASAQVRVANMGALQAALKVLAVHGDGVTHAAIAAATATVPSPALIDEASNAARLAACRAAFAQIPEYYVGTDKVLTIPINGTYIGMVEGRDPRNNSFLGGGSIDVPESFPSFSFMRINWQFNAQNDPRAPTPASPIGYRCMSGSPVERERGVINVSMRNEAFAQISGEASIYTQLDADNVHF